MKKDSSILLDHIIEAIASAERIVNNVTFEEYRLNEEKCLASIRVLEIIGEAAGQLKKIDQILFNTLDLQSSVGMRHVLIHDYDQVDLAIVWKTIQEDLPVIKKRILGSEIYKNSVIPQS